MSPASCSLSRHDRDIRWDNEVRGPRTQKSGRISSKPDVHVKEIFEGIGMCPIGSTDYEVFKAVAEVASNSGVTPYNVDKLFWLIGSWNFYDDPHIGNNGRVGRRKERKARFIEEARASLEQMREGEAPRKSGSTAKGGLVASATARALHGQEIDSAKR
jgi:hypothetical protein